MHFTKTHTLDLGGDCPLDEPAALADLAPEPDSGSGGETPAPPPEADDLWDKMITHLPIECCYEL